MNLHFGFIVVIIEIPCWEDVGTICPLELSIRESDFMFGCCRFSETGFLQHITCNTLTVRQNGKIRFRVAVPHSSLPGARASLD